MANTNQQVLQCEETIVGLLGKKQEIKQGHGRLDQKKKRVKRIKEDIKDSQAMLGTLKCALKCQRRELDKLNPKQQGEEEVESDGSRSGYESS